MRQIISMKQTVLTSTFGVLMVLSGCAPVAFMGAATSVATSAGEERGLGGVLSDAEIKTKIQMQWFDHKPELVNDIDIVVRQGRVLLTGAVDKPESQIEAVRLVWKVTGVREVIDETTAGHEGGGFTQYAKDSWISTQLKSKLLVDDDIRSLNYNIQTMGGIVYLMGIAQSKQELDKVVGYARHISGVKKVTSYVDIKPQGNIPTQKPAASPSRPEAYGATQGEITAPSQAPAPAVDLSVEQTPLMDQPLEITPSEPVPSIEDQIDAQPLNAPNTGSSFQ